MYSHAGTAPVPRKLAHWHNWHLNGNFVPPSIMSNTILVLSARDVEMVSASFSPQDVQSIMAHVFYTLSHVTDPLTGVAAPHRTVVDMLSHRALFMPARITGIGTAIKVVSVPSVVGDTRGLPATTLVLDEKTGAAKALINARSLTALRTAAGMS
jgi:ornithine cyclodeaminase/alanine dehydrogenase-like protein (mu-crystallin family)